MSLSGERQARITSAPSHEGTNTSNPTVRLEGARQWRTTQASSSSKNCKEVCVPHHTPKRPLAPPSLYSVYWSPSEAACPWSSPRPSWDRVQVQLPRLQQELTRYLIHKQREGPGQQKLHPLGLREHQWCSSFLPNIWPTVCYSVASRLHQLHVYIINISQTDQLEWLIACNVLHTCAHNVCPLWDIPPLSPPEG